MTTLLDYEFQFRIYCASTAPDGSGRIAVAIANVAVPMAGEPIESVAADVYEFIVRADCNIDAVDLPLRYVEPEFPSPDQVLALFGGSIKPGQRAIEIINARTGERVIPNDR